MFRTYHPKFSPATGGSYGCNKEEEQRIRGRRVASWILEDGRPPREWDTEDFIEVRSKVEQVSWSLEVGAEFRFGFSVY